MINLQVNDSVINDVEMVIFDKDGTLFDLYTYWHGMAVLRAHALCDYFDLPEYIQGKLLDVMGLDVPRRRIKPQGPIGTCSRQQVLEAVICYLNTVLEIDTAYACRDSFQVADDASIEFLHEFLKPLPGVVSLIKSLHSSGAKLALATMDTRPRAWLCLESVGLAEYFVAVAGSDSVKKSKPAPEQAALLLGHCNIVPEKTVCIGDGVKDILMAQNAGLKAAVAVSTGSASSQTLYEYTPLVVESLARVGVRYSVSSIK